MTSSLNSVNRCDLQLVQEYVDALRNYLESKPGKAREVFGTQVTNLWRELTLDERAHVDDQCYGTIPKGFLKYDY
jgi:hypothetical protein